MSLIYRKTVFGFVFLFLSILSLHSCGGSSLTGLNRMRSSERSVIIDTDLAFDDRLAILYVLNRPELLVKAITVSAGDGEECKQKNQDIQVLLALTKDETIPVACGSTHGLKNKVTNQPAVSLLTSVLQSSSQKVTILALGPLTNMAEVFRKSPNLIKRIEGMVIMGGAVHVPGNVLKPEKGITNPVAEWNFYSDPAAANLVLGLKVPITLIPLDATNQVPITDEFIERIKALQPTPQTAYVLNLLTAQHKPIAGRLYFWDPLAAAILCDETLSDFEKKHLRVLEGDGPARGQVIIDPAGPEVRAAFRVDRNLFERKLLEALTPLSLGNSE
ncbi:MAG: hypothetical protein C0407_10985 [Desulfobacca sp.]|nr:hypothetical protein [Desulfobacca sp.]